MRSIFAVLLVLALNACTAPRPIVDLRAVDPVAYQQDHNDCWVLIQRNSDPNVGVMAGPKAAATSAAGAAVVGVATGASSSVISADIVTGAIGGMIAGPMVDSYLQDIGKQFWVGRCLENRGYEIINADDVRLTPYKFCMMNCPISSGIGCGDWAEKSCMPGEFARLDRLKKEREERRARVGQRPTS